MGSHEAERPSRTRISRDLDGTREGKLRSLKASNSAYRGAITRVRRKIEQLMTDPRKYEEVRVEKSLLDRTFISYTKCCQDIKDCLCEDEVNELREIVNEHTNVCHMKENIDRKLEEWIAIVKGDLITDFKARPKLSELTTSRVNEHERLTTSSEFAHSNMQSYGALDIGNREPSVDGISPSMMELQYFNYKNETPESRRKDDVVRSSRASVVSESASIRRAKAELERQRCVEM